MARRPEPIVRNAGAGAVQLAIIVFLTIVALGLAISLAIRLIRTGA